MTVKRRAVKIEHLEPIQEAQAPKEEPHRHEVGPLGIYEPFTHENYEWKPVRNTKNHTNQDSAFIEVRLLRLRHTSRLTEKGLW